MQAGSRLWNPRNDKGMPSTSLPPISVTRLPEKGIASEEHGTRDERPEAMTHPQAPAVVSISASHARLEKEWDAKSLFAKQVPDAILVS